MINIAYAVLLSCIMYAKALGTKNRLEDQNLKLELPYNPNSEDCPIINMIIIEALAHEKILRR